MSASKTRDAMFFATGHHGGPYWHNLEDLVKFCKENEGEELIFTAELSVKLSKKRQMYAFYHRVILNCAIIGYTAAGWTGLDKVTADYMLRSEFAKDYVVKPDGSQQVIVLDKRNMTAPRLYKFLSDCVWFIENELQQTVPSAEEYRMKVQSGGINFKSVK